MMTFPKRSILGVALAAAVLTLSACGEDTGDGGGSAGGGSGSPQEAYAAFAQAIADDDQDAFDAAVQDGYWSDLQGVLDDNEANLALHHWQLENDVISLPEDPGEFRTGQDVLEDGAEGDVDEYAEQVGEHLGFDDLTGDDLAIVAVPEGYDVGASNAAASAGCVEDEKPIGECLDEAPGRRDTPLEVILVRGDDGWKVFGTEY